jgi:hypothetical protein
LVLQQVSVFRVSGYCPLIVEMEPYRSVWLPAKHARNTSHKTSRVVGLSGLPAVVALWLRGLVSGREHIRYQLRRQLATNSTAPAAAAAAAAMATRMSTAAAMATRMSTAARVCNSADELTGDPSDAAITAVVLSAGLASAKVAHKGISNEGLLTAVSVKC